MPPGPRRHTWTSAQTGPDDGDGRGDEQARGRARRALAQLRPVGHLGGGLRPTGRHRAPQAATGGLALYPRNPLFPPFPSPEGCFSVLFVSLRSRYSKWTSKGHKVAPKWSQVAPHGPKSGPKRSPMRPKGAQAAPKGTLLGNILAIFQKT